MHHKRKTVTVLSLAFFIATAIIVGSISVSANTVSSSTIQFQGSLTDNGDGTYTGIIPCIVSGSYDIYAKEGDTAWFGSAGPVWTSQAIGADHDAWPTWNPDTPDWYQYSLNLYLDGGQYKWAVRNHPGATETNPWYDTAFWGSPKPAAGVPMSGSMLWYSDGSGGYAEETDVGAYLPATGTPLIPGGAAGYGGGAHAWDMDWSWGSEVVPLEYPGFEVSVTSLGGGVFDVTMTPAVHQNTIPSSTLHFEGPLTPSGGAYTGTINMTDNGFYAMGGFDIYAEEGGTAYVVGSTWPIGSSHDAYSAAGPWGSWWDPDCPDWNQYQLVLTTDHWYLQYKHVPYYPSPMSGDMHWTGMYAAETDLGNYGVGYPTATPGTSVANGGGAQAWDIDWQWGTEVIPLELPGFDVDITDLGGGNYHVTLTPASLPQYTLTITSTTGGSTTPSGAVTQNIDTNVDVTAIPQAGYAFDYWQLDLVNVGSTNPYTVTFDADHALHAVFSRLPEPPVGGEADPITIPLNNPDVSLQLVSIVSLIALAMATVVFVRRRKKKQP